MKPSSILILTLVVLLSAGLGLRAQGLKPKVRYSAKPPVRKGKFQLYLLVGQSNMAGRGYPEAQDTVPNRRVLRLNQAGAWEVAKDPIHFDKPGAGVGPGLAFGKAMTEQDTSVVIGLIPCAVGGSGIAVWQPGAYYEATKTNPYDDAIARAKVAMQTGILKGIIWHQGETDSNPEGSKVYAQKLTELIASFRHDLHTPQVPFVAGQLPEFQFVKLDSADRKQVNASAVRVNESIAQLKKSIPHYAYVTAEGTKDRGDQLHFDAASARLMGQRYAAAMRGLLKKKPR
ncbi:sialate O-acetylesterase [Hymenobacter sp. GOD-10R]|uniref:sialate O-acetylesterase n=1 Tax=Hymenobacter sp. GOD-10R TaxID=3093922 RepID=UPI002D7A3145|nr:sialate O-acetylesterase [Hymenobacter sp. GOD-10R]WRQ26565.1 sialate O-acetylesterase [Hymenobacter sp. GOD-10R]